MKRFYLILVLVGAILPYVFFIQFFYNNGLDLAGFVSLLFVNPVAAGFTVDLLITSFVFWIWMIHRRRNSSAPNPANFILLNLLVGLSCTFPAYLYALSHD